MQVRDRPSGRRGVGDSWQVGEGMAGISSNSCHLCVCAALPCSKVLEAQCVACLEMGKLFDCIITFFPAYCCWLASGLKYVRFLEGNY